MLVATHTDLAFAAMLHPGPVCWGIGPLAPAMPASLLGSVRIARRDTSRSAAGSATGTPCRAHRPSPARSRCRAPRRPGSCSVRLDRGPRRRPSRDDERHRDVAPARWPANGPTAASSARWARSLTTMKAQSCSFFELPVRRAASRMRRRWSGSMARSLKRGRRARCRWRSSLHGPKASGSAT